MADYAISNVARRVVYTNTGVGPYAFTFEILANTDIAVYRGSTLLTLTTDYSVTINANGTGSVTLVTAGTGNISIVGARAIQRTSDYTTGGDLFASTLNVDLDSQTIYSQQVAETAERALKAPVTDPTDIAMTLPAKATRAGTVLAFNATTGNPEVGPNIASVTTVAAQSANINTVATNIASVNTVAGNSSNINTVAGISGNVTTVAGISANVTSVAGNSTNINTVATNIANVNSVGGNISNVNSVAGNSTNINAVNSNATNINTVAGNNTNISTVAGVSSSVSTVAGISANVTTVAGISSAVSTVATNNTNVSTVATNISAVNTNATNITAIQNASTNATNAAASAVSAGNAQTAAEAARDATLTAYDNFDDRYLGSKTSDPTLDNDGNALLAGSLYFNSVSGAMKVYTGSAWVAAYVSGSGYLASANNLSDVASLSSARTNLGLAIGTNVQAYDADLTAIAALAPTADNFIVGNGTTWTLETPSQARTSLGLGTAATTAASDYLTAANPNYIGTLTGGTGIVNLGSGQFYKDASGNVGIGTASPTSYGAGYTVVTLNNATTGTVIDQNVNGVRTGTLVSTSNITTLSCQPASGVLTFQTNGGAERMRIDASGHAIVGYTASVGTAYQTNMQVKGSSSSNYAGYGLITSNNESAGLLGVYSNGENSLWIASDPDNLRPGSRIVFSVDGTDQASIATGGNFSMNSGYGSSAVAYGCRAWVNYNGTGASIRGSGNVSSVTNNGTGDNTINFSTAMPDANFSWAVTQQLNGTGNADTGASSSARTQGTGAWGTGFVRILTMSNTNLSQENPLVLSVQIFR
jgi:hypothetical protein